MSISSGTMTALVSLGTQAAASIGSASATQISLSSGKSQISVQNTGTKPIWIGDSNVAPSSSRGWRLNPTDGYEFKECKVGFSFYAKCASGESSTLSIVEG